MKLGYCYTKQEKNNFFGAILIISENGFPVEFKYTEPVIPTKLQAVLYGKKLEKYVCYDVIIPELIHTLENKPDIFIVDSLNSFETNISIPVISIFQTSLEPLEKQLSFKKMKENEYLIQLSRIGSPIRITFKFTDFDTIMKLFSQFNENIDIMEPITRINLALEELETMFLK